MHAFNLFGQGVAFFRSARTLIRVHQPVEALPSLRGLTLSAACFEQIADPRDPGLGIVIRMALSEIAQIAADTDRVEQALDAAVQPPTT